MEKLLSTILILLTTGTGCSISSPDISAYTDEHYLKSVNKFTAIILPFDIGMQQEADTHMNSKFPSNYTKYYQIYKPTEEWIYQELITRLEKHKINSLLIIGPAYIVDELSKKSDIMLKTFKFYSNDPLIINEKVKGYMYNLNDAKLIGIFQVDIPFHSTKADFSNDILTPIGEQIAQKNLMVKEVNDIYLRK